MKLTGSEENTERGRPPKGKRNSSMSTQQIKQSPTHDNRNFVYFYRFI